MKESKPIEKKGWLDLDDYNAYMGATDPWVLKKQGDMPLFSAEELKEGTTLVEGNITTVNNNGKYAFDPVFDIPQEIPNPSTPIVEAAAEYYGKFIPSPLEEPGYPKFSHEDAKARLDKAVKKVKANGISSTRRSAGIHPEGNDIYTRTIKLDPFGKPLVHRNPLTLGGEGDSFAMILTGTDGVTELLRMEKNGDIFVKGNLASMDAQVVDAMRNFLRANKYQP